MKGQLELFLYACSSKTREENFGVENEVSGINYGRKWKNGSVEKKVRSIFRSNGFMHVLAIYIKM